MKINTGFCLLVSALLAVDFVTAFPGLIIINSTKTVDDLVPGIPKRQNAKIPLRILSLGASIVAGTDSADKNGFRKHLRDQLRFKGWEVNMVGKHEGTGGAVLAEVREYAKNSYKYKPNVVIINVGTNDANQNKQEGFAVRMEEMLKELWAVNGMSKTAIILSTVLPRGDPVAETNRQDINRQVIPLVARLQLEGRPIWFQNMPLRMPEHFLSDTIHPNAVGFKLMAKYWWIAIENVHAQGLISAAVAFEAGVGTKCGDKVPGDAVYGGITQKGSGVSDGIYYHDSQEMGTLWTYTSEFDRDQWFFARLYGRKFDDLVGWWITDGVVTFATWRNSGTGSFEKVSDMSTSLFCNPKGIWFVDLNADGYDDFLCVAPSGETRASINNKDGSSTTPPTFTYIGVIKSPEGYLQDRIRWADIDGDGRADYCVIDEGGNVWVWRNSGTTDAPAFWQTMGKRWTSQGAGGAGDIPGVRFEDINGDGRDDLLFVSNTGATTTWTNSRSCKPGQDGDGLNAYWRQGFWKGSSSGPTHAGVGDTRDRIHFGRIYGGGYFALQARADYIHMQSTKQADGRFKFDMKVWKNTGGGATKLEADGNKYCNMHGWADGRMDYVTTLSTGQMTVYPSLGKKGVTGDEVFWNTPKDLFNPQALIGKSLDRRDLHLIDWDNDGACDIVYVDPDNDNRMSVFINRYKTTGTFTWSYQPSPAPTVRCPERKGTGIDDLAVRFADISGNGLSEPDGRVWGYVHNTDGSWTFIDQFKKAEGIDRANLRWANVDGQGGDDMIWVDKWNGDGIVYTNNGRLDTGGSRYWFLKKGKQYDGSWAGTCQYFPDLDGDGRADLHSVMATDTNRAETFFNRCKGADSVGDDAGWETDTRNFGDVPPYVWPAGGPSAPLPYPSPTPSGILTNVGYLPTDHIPTCGKEHDPSYAELKVPYKDEQGYRVPAAAGKDDHCTTGTGDQHCWSEQYWVESEVIFDKYVNSGFAIDCFNTTSCDSTVVELGQSCSAHTVTNDNGFEQGIEAKFEFASPVAGGKFSLGTNPKYSYKHSDSNMFSMCTTIGGQARCVWSDQRCHSVWSAQRNIRVYGYIARVCNGGSDSKNIQQNVKRPSGKWLRGMLGFEFTVPINKLVGCGATCWDQAYPNPVPDEGKGIRLPISFG